MSDERTRKPSGLVRYDGFDAMPPPEPLSDAFRSMPDEEAERRASADPDAGETLPDFWDRAEATGDGSVTLRLDPDVLSFFRGLGRDYRGSMSAVLRRYVDEQRRAG